jgi:hypothetical protein
MKISRSWDGFEMKGREAGFFGKGSLGTRVIFFPFYSFSQHTLTPVFVKLEK